jgi:hypothetical protein
VPVARLAKGDHDRHGFRQQPPGDEAEDQSRGGVQPLGVLDDAEQRVVLGDGGQQAERRERDEEAVGRAPRRHPERDPQGFRLRRGERADPVEHRRAQLMDPGERELHLRLHARDLREPEARDLTGGVLHQRRLADARFAADDEDGALPAPRRGEQPVEPLALAGPAEERRAGRGHHRDREP